MKERRVILFSGVCVEGTDWFVCTAKAYTSNDNPPQVKSPGIRWVMWDVVLSVDFMYADESIKSKDIFISACADCE